MIVDIDNQTIDISQVERVGSLYGDSTDSWSKYKVYFRNGNELELYEELNPSVKKTCTKMNRDEFIKLWKGETQREARKLL